MAHSNLIVYTTSENECMSVSFHYVIFIYYIEGFESVKKNNKEWKQVINKKKTPKVLNLIIYTTIEIKNISGNLNILIN